MFTYGRSCPGWRWADMGGDVITIDNDIVIRCVFTRSLLSHEGFSVVTT